MSSGVHYWTKLKNTEEIESKNRKSIKNKKKGFFLGQKLINSIRFSVLKLKIEPNQAESNIPH